MDHEAAVRKGAAFLDERRPGWRKKVDLSSLDMENAAHCLLGQVLGSYHMARPALGLSDENCLEMGFASKTDNSYWVELLQNASAVAVSRTRTIHEVIQVTLTRELILDHLRSLGHEGAGPEFYLRDDGGLTVTWRSKTIETTES